MSRGYYVSYCWAFYETIFLLIYILDFLLCALENYGCHKPPLLKVILKIGEFLFLRFFDNALTKSSGSLLTIYLKLEIKNLMIRWININGVINISI